MTRRLRTRVLVELDGDVVLVDEQLHLEQHTDPPKRTDGMPWLELFAGVVDSCRRARDTYYSDHTLELNADTAPLDTERNATT